MKIEMKTKLFENGFIEYCDSVNLSNLDNFQINSNCHLGRTQRFLFFGRLSLIFGLLIDQTNNKDIL